MADIEIDIPHFAVPFKMGASGAATIEQDSVDDVFQCVQAICRTPRGTRLEQPDFGIDEIVLRENGPERDKLQRTIDRWEPRARIEINISDPDFLDQMYTLVEVNVGGSF